MIALPHPSEGQNGGFLYLIQMGEKNTSKHWQAMSRKWWTVCVCVLTCLTIDVSLKHHGRPGQSPTWEKSHCNTGWSSPDSLRGKLDHSTNKKSLIKWQVGLNSLWQMDKKKWAIRGKKHPYHVEKKYHENTHKPKQKQKIIQSLVVLNTFLLDFVSWKSC
jgi:hypothetical protein